MPVILGGNGIYLASLAPPVDPDAQAFLTAAAITDPTITSAINTLVVDMKGYGIWTKMKAIYPFVGGTATTHKFNLKNPLDTNAAFRLIFSGGWTHSVNGALPNGTNAYADTFLTPLNNLLLNSTHLSYYSRTNIIGPQVEIGVVASGVPMTYLIYNYNGTAFKALNRVESTVGTTFNPTNGLLIGSRISSTTEKYYHKGVLTNTITANSLAPNNSFKIFLGCYSNGNNPSWFSSKQVAFASIGDGLTDTEAANFYTAVQAFQTTLGRSIGTQTVSDADAQAFVTNAGIVDQVEANAVNNLVIGLKADGIWTKMKAIYPFVGGTATTHKFNLKDPRDLDAAFRLVFNGGWTHSSTGADPNGTNAYADTFLNFNTTMLLNDAALSFYSREDIFTAVLMGCGWDNITSMISPNFSSGVGEYSTINGGGNGTGVANKSGLFTISRLTSTNVIGYRNGSQYFNRAFTSTSKPNFKVYIGARNGSGGGGSAQPNQYSSNQCAFSAIHDGLTATEAANLYTAVQAFQTTLSRNV